MTDREALIILAAGFANQQYIAAGAVDEAIEALKLIDEHLDAHAAGDEPDELHRPPWAIWFGDELINTHCHGDTLIAIGSEHNVLTCPKYKVWPTPSTGTDDWVPAGSRDDVDRMVKWDEWGRVNSR